MEAAIKTRKYINKVKTLIIIDLTIVLYFVGLYLINLYKIDWVIIGVFREILTIPFLIGQIVFLCIGVHFLIKMKSRNILMIISLILLTATSVITIGSFF